MFKYSKRRKYDDSGSDKEGDRYDFLFKKRGDRLPVEKTIPLKKSVKRAPPTKSCLIKRPPPPPEDSFNDDFQFVNDVAPEFVNEENPEFVNEENPEFVSEE